MSLILNKVHDVDPNDSDAVKDALTTFFQSLSKHTEVDSIRWLRVLENIINRFPKYCGSHRTTIETYLTNFLDSNNYYIVIEAAKCGHALQQVRPSQEKGATAKTCWREQMNALCEAAHSLIEAIFVNTVNIYKKSGKKGDPKSTSNSPLSIALNAINNVGKTQNSKEMNRKSFLCIRLRNIFVFLQAMLVEVYPVAKPIQPQLILEVIVQALSVSSGTNSKDSSDVTTVKTQALRTLDALVACLGSNMIPFSALVFRFVMQTLRWSTENPSEESRKVRCVAYSSLSKWLCMLRVYRADGVGGGGGRGRVWEDDLTDHVLRDVTPPRRVMQLVMSAQPTKNLSKKAKRKLANSMLKESNIASHMPGEKNKITESEQMNDEVAIAALECAETFLTVCGIFLKPTTHKLFQERLVRESYDTESCGAERALRVLRALECARRSAPAAAPPPTQYCLQLYSVLINCPQREISSFCSQALLDIRLHLHCSPPSLNFAVELQPQKQKNDDKRKRISDRNRAVLESLLGAERMPSEDLQEEIITIHDEPSSKKPRIEEDIADKISLSSESVNSVEIRDGYGLEDTVEEEVAVNIQEANSDRALEEIEEPSIFEDRQGSVEECQEIVDLMPAKNTETELENPRSHEIENIHEATTQMPLNISNDTFDGVKSPVSMEIAYDFPNTATDKITVLEKLEDENLPSTNDTDDVQITCGQVVTSSQDAESEKKAKIDEDVPKVNGIDKSPENVVENGDITDVNERVAGKIAPKNDGVTVEDMLADFVDEVNDENKIDA